MPNRLLFVLMHSEGFILDTQNFQVTNTQNHVGFSKIKATFCSNKAPLTTELIGTLCTSVPCYCAGLLVLIN